MVQQLLEKTVTETTTFAPTCGQCAHFRAARERVTEWGVQVRPAHCLLLAQAGFDNVRRDSTSPVDGCRQFLQDVDF